QPECRGGRSARPDGTGRRSRPTAADHSGSCIIFTAPADRRDQGRARAAAPAVPTTPATVTPRWVPTYATKTLAPAIPTPWATWSPAATSPNAVPRPTGGAHSTKVALATNW